MYRATYRLASALAYAVPLPSGRLRTSIAGRRAALRRWSAWGRSRGSNGPLVWLHGASVGELATAEPVIRQLLRDDPRITLIVTHSSPSAAAWQPPAGVVRSDLVPPDRPRDAAQALDLLRPSLLLFSRGDLWPELVFAAAARRIPVAVMAATVRPMSTRLRWPVRSLYARVLGAVSWVGAVTEGDAARWIRLGAPPVRVAVTGDPRHDAVLERVPELGRLARLQRWRGGDPTLIAGSVESADRSVLLEAARAVLDANPSARLVVVPHEPDTWAVADWRQSARRAGLQMGSWTPDSPDTPDARVLLAAARGLLADLYALGALAYVGGGFRRRGLHAVAEPAAWALPMVIGPHWHGAADARLLLDAGGAVALTRRRATAGLASVWSDWLADDRGRVTAGLAARGVLTRGAARRTARALADLLAGPNR